MSNVMVIAPHMDDEVLGCGMAIANHVARGDEVCVLMICGRSTGDTVKEMACAIAAQKVLGYQHLMLGGNNRSYGMLRDRYLHEDLNRVIDLLEDKIQEFKPEVCYVPHSGDTNQDHRTVFSAAQVALRPHANYGKCQEIYCYEIPSGTEGAWSAQMPKFSPNAFVSGPDLLSKKLLAWEAYPTQHKESPNPRSSKNLGALAAYRGARFGVDVAEAFEVQFMDLTTVKRGD